MTTLQSAMCHKAVHQAATLSNLSRRTSVSVVTEKRICHPQHFPFHCKTWASRAEKRSLKDSPPVRREFHSAHRSLYRQPNPANQNAIASATQQTTKQFRPQASQVISEGHLIKPESIQPGVNKTFNRFDMAGTATIVTGGSQGLGLAMAEGLAEAGSKVYCIDRGDQPSQHFKVASERLLPYDGGQLHYRQADITDTKALDNAIADIAAEHQRLDGVIAAAGIMKVSPALEYDVEDARKMLDVNFTGVLMTATSAARQMMKYKTQGSICLVASMSGLIANKGLISPVYNASKAAVIQLARSLSMEWGRGGEEGVDGIRVNCLSPGHIVTPMVRKNLEEIPGVRETWESENMMGRISEPEEFKGAGLFLLSKASSFMTGNNLVIDGGHTAW
ncbi:hypothetical protein D0859_07558 [Hortaea werneckii]|uniref:Uncharacterized protein n=1 Tax=Hortaea werneckii TaxID=91943 RepID=A0A3M7IS95_HORWE|nr:hypothetical protein D0859_07558 [Hortaea werneckii]